MVNGIQFAWEAFFPLFAFTSKELGGLGLGVRPLPSVHAELMTGRRNRDSHGSQRWTIDLDDRLCLSVSTYSIT